MKTSSITYRLTVLWALNESVLGGFLHAVQVPFTGIMVGGIAVAIICLIGLHNERPFAAIWKATLSVLVVKLLISPYTPFPAYVAVLFQCFVGSFFFLLFGYRRWAVMLFSVLAMVESAIQKVLVLTLIFGKELWTSINQFSDSVLKQFGLHVSSYSQILIVAYVAVYFLWGVILGLFVFKLPAAIAKKEDIIQTILSVGNSKISPAEMKKTRQNFFKKIILFLIVLSLVFYFTHSAMLMLKSILVIVSIYFIIPLLLQKIIQLLKIKNNTTQLIQDMTALKTDAVLVWQYTHTHYKNLKAFYQFILLLFAISIYAKNE